MHAGARIKNVILGAYNPSRLSGTCWPAFLSFSSFFILSISVFIFYFLHFFCAPFVPHPRAMWAFIVPTVYPPWWMTWVDDLEWRGHGGGNASSSSTVLLAPAGA